MFIAPLAAVAVACNCDWNICDCRNCADRLAMNIHLLAPYSVHNNDNFQIIDFGSIKNHEHSSFCASADGVVRCYLMHSYELELSPSRLKKKLIIIIDGERCSCHLVKGEKKRSLLILSMNNNEKKNGNPFLPTTWFYSLFFFFHLKLSRIVWLYLRRHVRASDSILILFGYDVNSQITLHRKPRTTSQ